MSSKFILGTVQFGLDYGINNSLGKPTSEQVFKILKYAVSHGITEIDTADAYGNAVELLGVFNKSHPDLFSINTKFKINNEPLSKQLDNVLNYLGLKNVNTYFYHSYSDFINCPELLHSLVSLKQNDKIKKIGISVYGNDEFKTSINTTEIDVIQFPFNLLDNYSQRGDLMKLAKDKGKKLQVRSIFLQGLFFKTPDKIPYKLDLLKPYLCKIHDLAKEYNVTIEQLAISFTLQQVEIDNIIIGVDNLKQLKRNINIAETMKTDEINEIINNIHVIETELLYPKNW